MILSTIVMAALVSGSHCAQGSENDKIAQTVGSFFRAYAAKDSLAAISSWSSQSLDYRKESASLSAVFKRIKSVELKSISFLPAAVAGEKATVRVTTDIEGQASPPEVGSFGKHQWMVRLVREDTSWKIDSVLEVHIDLARQIAAQPESQWEVLLAANRDLVDPALVMEVEDETKNMEFSDLAYSLNRLALKVADDLRDVVGQARAHNNMAGCLRAQNRFPEAMAEYEEALPILERSDRGQFGICLYNIGALERTLGKVKPAVAHFKSALGIFQEVHNTLAEGLTDGALGSACQSQGKYDDALSYFNRALSIHESAGNSFDACDVYQRIGSLWFQQDEYERAIEAFEKELAEAKKAKLASAEATAYNSLGVSSKRRGYLDDAQAYFEQALAIREKAGPSPELGLMYSNVADVLGARGDYEGAMKLFERSLEIKRQLGDRHGMFSPLTGEAYVDESRGNHGRALVEFQSAIDIAKEFNDDLQVARAQANLGSVYGNMGNGDLARASWDAARPTFRKLGMRREEAAMMLNQAESDAGSNYPRAIAEFESCLATFGSLGVREPLAEAMIGAAGAYSKHPAGFKKSVEYYERAGRLGKDIGNEQLVYLATQGLADFYFARGEYVQSASYGSQAIQLATKMHAGTETIDARTTLGNAYSRMNRKDEAARQFELAVFESEALDANSSLSPEDRESVLESQADCYLDLVSIQFHENRFEMAFRTAEMEKARALRASLTAGSAHIRQGMSVSELDRERRLRVDITTAQIKVRAEEGRKRLDVKAMAAARQQLAKAKIGAEAFRSILYASHPDLKAKRAQTPVVDAVMAARLLPDANSALIEFSVCQDDTFVFVISKRDGLRVYATGLSGDRLTKLISSFRKDLSDPNHSVAGQARSLYARLLGPAKAVLNGKRHLIMVPDGPLWNLPFQALQSSEGRYLVEDADVALAPSLTALVVMRLERDALATQRIPSDALSFLGVANPGLQRDPGVQRSSDASLPLAEVELNAIAQKYEPSKRMVLTRSEATRIRVVSNIERARVLHFATHGMLNDERPFASYLKLARDSSNKGEADLLEARDILDMRLHAKLAVLSACDSGRGRIGRGEGVVGLSWSFFVAGCPTVVASLWPVDSAATRSLMVGLHNNLSSMSGSAALRKAELAVLSQPQYRHPYYWSGFVLVGDGR